MSTFRTPVREVVVFALLERVSPGDWERYRGLFQTLRYSFPIVVVNRKHKGRVRRKIIAFLKRHEVLWTSMYELLGWKVVERYEMGMEELRKQLEGLRKFLETLKGLEDLPEWLSESLKPGITLGDLPLDKAVEFMELVEKRFREYMEAPKAIADAGAARTRFHKLLRTSKISALVIGIGGKNEQLKRVGERIYELLEKGIAPIDYSYNAIIVAKKSYRYRGVEKTWRSSLGLDPEKVLKDLETRYEIVVPDVKLEFEKRDVGWGLKPLTE